MSFQTNTADLFTLQDVRQCGEDCNSTPYSDADLARTLCEESFGRYFKSRLRHKEAQLAQELDAQNKIWLAAELQRLRAADEETREMQAARRHVEDNLLNLRCPHCSLVFEDWDACAAVQHAHDHGGCKGYFCGWCMKPCTDSVDAHQHAAQCPLKPDSVDGLFAPAEAYGPVHSRIRLHNVRAYLRELRENIRQKLVPLIAPHFSSAQLI
eukprot:gene2035-2725_t